MTKQKNTFNSFPNYELDPILLDIFQIFSNQGNMALIDLQDKIEKYVDSRIGLYLKERTKSN